MMWTSSLRRRVTSTALASFLVVTAAIGVATYRDVAALLEADLAELLEVRRGVADEVVVRSGGDLAVAASDLAAIGIAARVVTDEGVDLSVQPTDPAVTLEVPDVRDAASTQASLIITEGGRVEVLAGRGSADRLLARLRLVLMVGLAAGAVMVLMLVDRAIGSALRPLDRMRAVIRGITGGVWGERMRLDDAPSELGALAQDFDLLMDASEAAVTAARTAEQSQRRFVADVAHQLRTPMAGMRVSTELLLLQGDLMPEERERLLGNLVRETTRASRMVNDLLRISRFDLGEGLLLEPCDLLQLCEKEVARQVELVDVPVALMVIRTPLTQVLVDPDQFGEVLANLLDNARRFAVSRIEVTVAQLDDGQSVIRVIDDGPGLSAQDRERAFERFVTLDSGSGSGLGLPIARGIVRAHGGELEFRDGGFEIRLPGRPIFSELASASPQRALS